MANHEVILDVRMFELGSDAKLQILIALTECTRPQVNLTNITVFIVRKFLKLTFIPKLLYCYCYLAHRKTNT